MKTSVTRIAWKLCEPGWWDAMRGQAYAGWSVARQCRVRRVKGELQSYQHGWYVFNDALNKMIGPFGKPETAMRACPLV